VIARMQVADRRRAVSEEAAAGAGAEDTRRAA
jgi:hypothetical protein